MSIDAWRGRLGIEYTLRNQPDVDEIREELGLMLDGVGLGTILEVGCNRGLNLKALDYCGWVVMGVEPNQAARTLAKKDGVTVIDGDICDLPFSSEAFDLVFTAGVLIHIPPDQIDRALDEMVRVSSRYVLAIEYYAKQETRKKYRGDWLWKRPYGHMLRGRGLELQRGGVAHGPFAGCSWWLFSKYLDDHSGEVELEPPAA